MGGQVFRVARYRFTATFGRSWGGYLSIVLLIGLLGGLAMGSLAGARRTQSSFATFLASTNPSDLTLFLQAPDLTRQLGHLPGVERVESAIFSLNAFPLAATGAPNDTSAMADGDVMDIGGLNGEYFDQDRVTVTKGRMANPNAAAEFVATAQAAQLLGWHVDEVIPFGFYTNAQTNEPAFGTTKVKAVRRLEMRLVGTVVFNNEVVLDEVDRYPTFLLFTPSVTRRFAAGPQYEFYGLKVRDGPRGVPAVEREITQALPKGTTYSLHETSIVEGQVDRTVKPEAVALWVFGAISLLAALLIAMQVIARQIQAKDQDLGVLRALGADRAMTMGDGLFGVLGAVLLGSLLAVGVAIGLSPLWPIGPVREVYPSPGVAVDYSVLGFGLLALIGGVGAAATALAYRWAPRRTRGQETTRTEHGSSLARLAGGSGAPVSAVVGVTFALEPGRGRSAVPVRSALFGTALAVLVVAATLTFGSGLATLVSHPSLYGWNWSYALSSSAGADVPPQSTALLGRDRFVAAWSGVDFADVEIDGQTVPAILASTGAPVAPLMLSGHALQANNQIVLGAATLAQLHKRVGGSVVAS